ncbi:protein bunched, class 2/F/G isoform-like isoform X2 [Ostrinia nubilalis]|uniref:protein bunched, class 2/F/G isoform-like isoform X2 n=1 Tax=Ostrinia nubilalis TaxID=29057 RepID=UPI0030825166
MADNLIQKSHKTSEKNKYNNVVHRTTSESLRLNESEKGMTHPTTLQAAHNPRKISSFQITSVTVGSRVSTDAGEDSADDLDESHTDDISRVTDIENETPSYSEDTFSKDDVFYNASSASLGCAPVIPTSSQYGLAIVGQDNNTNQIGGAVPNSNNSEVSDMHVSVTNAGTGSIINLIGNAKPQEGMKEIQEHVRNERFKVVKIESTEPFRRGRWMCMDYLDHTTTPQNAPITLNNNLDITDPNLQAPDSGVVINDCQHDEMSNDLTNKGPMDLQGNPPVQQLEQTIQKQFPMASPGQSLTQPLNVVQQQMPVAQSVSVQSPPLEMPQQMPNQNMPQAQQVGQQHPQSMTHITMQNAPQTHPQAPQQQQVQQIPQSFPQHQLQQVIAQSQGIPMQQIPMHQQMPQQMQQIPNQQMQQMNQHIPQPQMTNMQMQQQLPQMQAMQNQGQMSQVASQQPQMTQMQLQQMQGQPNPQQIHMQQAQIPNMGQGHHLQGQQSMGAQQQLQQIQALQNQQIPNHIQQMQMPTQQQIPQMQTQMHQIPTQPQQSVVPGMHPQMSQQGMTAVQPQYNQAVNQQSNPQTMISATLPSSQQPMVQTQHNVPQFHTQQPQMSQQGQTLPQEVLTSIVTSQQGATLPSNLQPMASQPQGSTLPANLQSLNQQQAPVHTMAPQQGTVPQGNIQMMTTAPQNMQMTLDGNQPSMQIPASDPIFMQPANVGQQMPVGQHMAQQNMLPQQVSGQGQIQYVPSQAVPQVSMAHQNIPMSMQQNMPVGMGGGVHANVVQSQTSMGLGYGGVVPVMSQSSVAPVEATVSGTNSPVVSLPVSSTAYANTAQPGHDNQGFGSPVSAVVSHAISGAVMSNVNVSACDSGAADVPADGLQAGDTGDGKDEPQTVPPPEDESASGTSAVAIDNKIEQAMDLVKSHLMFAVREEVEVLKERIAELMERINQLEVENTYLRAHASQDTLAQLPAAGTKPPPQPQGPPPPVS